MRKTSKYRGIQSGESFEKGNNFSKKVREGIKSTPGALRYYLKGTAEKFDQIDKQIGEKIEEKRTKEGKNTSGKLKKILRENMLKLALGLSITTGVAGPKIAEAIREGKQDKIEVTVDGENITIDVKELFNEKDVIHDLKGGGKARQDKRYNNYSGNNELRNTMNNNFGIHERKKVIEGICIMIESGDIEMIFKKADEAGVPRQCIYLALAESGWTAGANSGVARGWWQFTAQSAIDFNLNKKGGKDNRGDKVLSTEAAMRHLKANYGIVRNYEKELKYNLSESDRRYLAFCMFNGSPKLVKSGVIACKGNINNYPDMLRAKNGGKENNNYVARILAIEDYIENLFKENNYNLNEVKEIGQIISDYLVKSADKMYEEYLTKSSKLTTDQRIEEIKKIMKKYDDEFKANLITKKYHDGAIEVLKKEIKTQEDVKAAEVINKK